MKRTVLPEPLVRAVLDAGVDLYPASDDLRAARRERLLALIDARRKRRAAEAWAARTAAAR